MNKSVARGIALALLSATQQQAERGQRIQQKKK